ncbi:MAG: type II toxin-antitoxin system HicA family toxin [Candidatus Peribacteria bacterium]|jgi:predicted RNA binding protein YcfA (HicA-like mRNA interferase family)|nr:type II toxin-antitoxin system HicA family toxin [Candidatus Peribacteria bacterium]
MGVRNWAYVDSVRLLKYKGFHLERNGKGSHEYRYNSETKRGTTLVKPHGGDKLSADGTFLRMLAKAGISKEEAIAFKE